ncbi:MAG: hypothetical protein AB7D06_15430 [Pedobacter sp.]|jgi:uncharacterized protein YcfL
MKKLSFAIATILLLTGCASMQEAYYVDRDFGQQSQAAWDQQVAYPDYRYASTIPENLDGITAEEIMKVYNETFAEKPENVNIINFGLNQ